MGRRAKIGASQFGLCVFARFAGRSRRFSLTGVLCSALLVAWLLVEAGREARSAHGGESVGGWVPSGQASVVINEVLYDPAGKDADLEFVELFNPSGTAIALEGWTLATGNGSYSNRWTLEWTGGESDTIDARCFFVVGEAMVSPSPDAVTDLDLQNGPDACRLVSTHGTCDVVGWGEHVYPEYYEEEPASQVSSGCSLGRSPDGRDTDDNASDLEELAGPSPADFNHPPCDLALTRAGLSRYATASGLDLDITSTIVNLGTEPCGQRAAVRAALGPTDASSVVPEPVVPAATAKIVVRLPNPGEGLHSARVWLECDADRWKANDSLSTSVMVPPSPVVINEVMFRPAGGDCEWVEILNRSATPYSLAGWQFEDSGGRQRTIADEDLTLEAAAYLVLVEDEGVFAACYGDSAYPSPGQSIFLRPKGGWPTLNDADGPLGFADAIVLRDTFGTRVDSMVYGEAWSRPGVSIERIDSEGTSTASSNWSPHYGTAGGSPGKPNSVSMAVPGGGSILTLSPSSFTPDGDGHDDLVAIAVRPPAAGSVRVSVFDMNGRLVRRLIDGEPVEALRITFWNGTDDHGSQAPVGIYVVGLEAKVGRGAGTHRAKAPLVLTRR